MYQKNSDETGFTVVEVVVTLVITSLFLAFFFQLYLVGESQRVKVSQQTTASNISYANLNKVVSRSFVETNSSAPVACDTTAGSVNRNNLSINPSASGSNLTAAITLESATGYGQTVTAFFPRGCGLNMPVKIESAVTYGSPEETVIHATYVN